MKESPEEAAKPDNRLRKARHDVLRQWLWKVAAWGCIVIISLGVYLWAYGWPRQLSTWGSLASAIGLTADIMGVWMLAGSILISRKDVTRAGTWDANDEAPERVTFTREEGHWGMWLVAIGFALQFVGATTGLLSPAGPSPLPTTPPAPVQSSPVPSTVDPSAYQTWEEGSSWGDDHVHTYHQERGGHELPARSRGVATVPEVPFRSAG